jgi:putative ABC transport system ATP-binding protein
MIRLEGVNKTYFLGEEAVNAVADANLVIKTGEMVSLVGPSGCGKSTLMHIIGLLDLPSSGRIYIDDRDVSELSDQEQSDVRNRNIGFVFQQFNLINKFTVWENVILPTRYAQKRLEYDPEARAEELLKMLGIWERRDFFPNNISGGQQQRAAIARALIMKPKLILADEPTGNLDSKTGKEILNLLKKLNRELKVTIVIVTHDPDIAKLSRRQIQMSDGMIIKQ